MPDVLVLGPFNLPTYGVSLIVGVLVFSALVPRLAPTFGLSRTLAEEVASRAVVGLIVGAKLAEVLRSPATFLARPRLLLALPRGAEPLLGALLGVLLSTLPVWWPRRRHAAGLLDTGAVPLLAMAAVVASGTGGPQALPLGAGLALAAAATYHLIWKGRSIPSLRCGYGFLPTVWTECGGQQVIGALRRLIILIFAGWLPHDSEPSGSYLGLNTCVRDVALAHRCVEDTPYRGP